MNKPNEDTVFGRVTLRNYRSYLPTSVNELHGAFGTSPQLAPIDESRATEKWYALIVQLVHNTTKKYPAARYSTPGEIYPSAEWTADAKLDLINELVAKLYGKDDVAPETRNNQFSYIVGAAREREHVYRLLAMGLTRLLLARATQTALGHLESQLLAVLKKPRYVDTTPGTKQFRLKKIGLKGYTTPGDCSDADQERRAANMFEQMRRNKVDYKVLNPDGPERFPRLYNTSEFETAVTRIITEIACGAVTPAFLVRALGRALGNLDETRKALPEQSPDDTIEPKSDEFSSDSPDDVPIHKLRLLDRDGDNSPEGEHLFNPAEPDQEVITMANDIRSQLDNVDLTILSLRLENYTNKAMADRLNIAAKTVTRRNKKIESVLAPYQTQSRDDLVLALRHLVSSVHDTQVKS